MTSKDICDNERHFENVTMEAMQVRQKANCWQSMHLIPHSISCKFEQSAAFYISKSCITVFIALSL